MRDSANSRARALLPTAVGPTIAISGGRRSPGTTPGPDASIGNSIVPSFLMAVDRCDARVFTLYRIWEAIPAGSPTVNGPTILLAGGTTHWWLTRQPQSRAPGGL